MSSQRESREGPWHGGRESRIPRPRCPRLGIVPQAADSVGSSGLLELDRPLFAGATELLGLGLIALLGWLMFRGAAPARKT